MMEKRYKWTLAVAIIYDVSVISAALEAALSCFPVYSGFVPDTLTCATLLPYAIGVGGAFTLIYTASAAKDHDSDGTLGLNAFAFQTLLMTEIGVAVGLAIPASVTGWGRTAYYGGAAIIAHTMAATLQDRIDTAKKKLMLGKTPLVQLLLFRQILLRRLWQTRPAVVAVSRVIQHLIILQHNQKLEQL